ncbi:MAG TPA: hypothetical protein VGR06_39130, partial [Actinophytocola sp.]|uniref:hypothetical protein n=1 Tax=Actinophytocola sp. TaxID=1872138 RepID=UPI002DF7C428|nr:hypothetical protein [Actinophytocola sp.]
ESNVTLLPANPQIKISSACCQHHAKLILAAPPESIFRRRLAGTGECGVAWVGLIVEILP